MSRLLSESVPAAPGKYVHTTHGLHEPASADYVSDSDASATMTGTPDVQAANTTAGVGALGAGHEHFSHEHFTGGIVRAALRAGTPPAAPPTISIVQ